MKTIILYFGFTIYSFTLLSQDCSIPRASVTIQKDRLVYKLGNHGDRQNSVEQKAYFTLEDGVQRERDLILLDEVIPVIGGTTRAGSLKLNSVIQDEYRWVPGPLMEWNESNHCEAWDTIFHVKYQDILKAIQIIKSDGNCSEIPASIIDWPARERGDRKFSPYYFGADFSDANNDGKYDPCDGDLPYVPMGIIQGFTAFPDHVYYRVLQSKTLGRNIKGYYQLQMEEYHFTYDLEGMDNTIFSVRRFNQGIQEDLIDTYLPLVLDPYYNRDEHNYVSTSSLYDLLMFDINQERLIPDDRDVMPHLVFKLLGGPPVAYASSNVDGRDTFIISPQGSGKVDSLGWSDKSRSIVVDNLCNRSPLDECIDYRIFSDIYFRQLGLDKEGHPMIDIENNPTLYTADIMEQLTDVDEYRISDPSFCFLNSGPTLLQSGIRPNLFLLETVMFLQPEAEEVKNCAKRLYNIDKGNFISSFYDRKRNRKQVLQDPVLHGKIEEDKIQLHLLDIPFEFRVPVFSNGLDPDWLYHFEGVQVYQVKDTTVTRDQLSDPDYAQLVYQGDIINGIDDISNWEVVCNDDTGQYSEILKVEGEDKGIDFDIELKYDYINNRPLHKDSSYYYTIVSYMYNEYLPFNENNISALGQKERYKESSNSISVYKIKGEKSSIMRNPFVVRNQVNEIKLLQIEGPLEYDLIDVQGRTVFSNTNKNRTSAEINLTKYDLPSGIYFLKVKDLSSNNLSIYKCVLVN